MMSLYGNQKHGDVNEQVSTDSLSVGTIWGVQVEVNYKVKNAGVMYVKYYLSRLPAKRAKSLAWSSFRHEMKLFFAANINEAMGVADCNLMRDDDALFASMPQMKNASVQFVRVSFVEFTPNQAKTLEINPSLRDQFKQSLNVK